MRSKNQDCYHLRKGFTLVELLAVIAIIAITSLAIGMSGTPSSAQSLKSAQSTLATMMQTAQSVAASKSSHARLLINVDVSDPDRYLRQIGIIYCYDEGADPIMIDGDEMWVAVGDGVLLPEGTLYMPPEGGNIQNVDGGSIVMSDSIGPEAAGGGYSQHFEFPISRQQQMLSDEAGSSAQWIYYEFNPNGIVSHGCSNKMVIVYAGRLVPTPNDEVKIRIDNEDAIGGFLLTMLGGIIPFPDKAAAENITN